MYQTKAGETMKFLSQKIKEVFTILDRHRVLMSMIIFGIWIPKYFEVQFPDRRTLGFFISGTVILTSITAMGILHHKNPEKS